ncbi:retrovirus-related pol polyprotein from transposon tnt 1-94 [Lasius niger]|uniref:Retrovirus-related pol polyprotein from transposon tnt 1-94 n=1 Tax=Lasius niger TaxID=67767 RepID=A0A0J7KNR7_LASNI|nr:retrovirus-related pol polyprotein from transposon tnt 1-94 [Lasius niger]
MFGCWTVVPLSTRHTIEPGFRSFKVLLEDERVCDIENCGSVLIEQYVNDEDFVCELCEFGKQHRLPFKKTGSQRLAQIGEFTHSDFVEAMQEPSLGGAKFFVVFKDDCSGFRSDDQDFTDRYNGAEYCNKVMLDYLASQGIQLETIAPSQQNGRSERQSNYYGEFEQCFMQVDFRCDFGQKQ